MTNVLPSIESTPVMIMRFTEKADSDLIFMVEDRLVEGGLRVVTKEADEVVVIGLTTTQEKLETEADAVRLIKKRADTKIMEPFDTDIKEKFYDTESDYDFYDQNGLFNSNDRALLVWRILEDIMVLPVGQLSSNLSRKLDSLHVVYRRPLSSKLFGSKDEPSVADHPTQSLRYVLQRSGFIDVVTTLHQNHICDAIWKEARSFLRFGPPSNKICQYFGEEIAFYFAWMGFLSAWLLFPGIVGLCAYGYRWWRAADIDHDEYTPFYGLITFLWAVVFLKYWKRQESRLSYKWGTLVGGYEKQSFFATRPEFHGRLRVSPVTGQLETYYPAIWRRLKYIVSALITIFMLSIAFMVMICSLNLQGYINPKNDPARWHEENQHPFHIPALSELAEPGQIFDATSSWRSLIPVVLHVACILTLNSIYRNVATRLTEWENHQTVLSFENSLILKRFLFEAFDCYVALFYLAFFERNIERLRTELISVFNVDTVRRLALECLLPYILQKMNRKVREVTIRKKRDITSIIDYQPLTEESQMDEYEQFDDYMEIVIQFGYVTLFASAYPLASIISVLANLIEMRSDCFKLTKLCQRPRTLRSDGLGMWLTLLSVIVWLSALTNCLLFGFTSKQMMAFLPSFYLVDDTNHLRLKEGTGWILIFIIFGLERVLLWTGLLLHACIPDVPEDVVDEMERKLFILELESRLVEKTEDTKKDD